MRGFQRVYNLEKKIYEAAVRGLTPVRGPMPVQFPLPDPCNPFSLKPGSISINSDNTLKVEKSSSLTAAITGARAAATQFNKNDQNRLTNNMQNYSSDFVSSDLKSKPFEEHKTSKISFNDGPDYAGQSNQVKYEETSKHSRPLQQTTGGSKILFGL